MKKLSIQALETELENFATSTSVYPDLLFAHFNFKPKDMHIEQSREAELFLQSIGADLIDGDILERDNKRYAINTYKYNGYKVILYIDLEWIE